MKRKVFRHGDMGLVKIDSLPEGLKEAKTKVLMTGSGGNDHTFLNGHFYPKQVDRFIFGYFVADKDCKLLHPDHGEKKKGEKVLFAELEEGIYELRKQFEDTHEGMRQVED